MKNNAGGGRLAGGHRVWTREKAVGGVEWRTTAAADHRRIKEQLGNYKRSDLKK